MEGGGLFKISRKGLFFNDGGMLWMKDREEVVMLNKLVFFSSDRGGIENRDLFEMFFFLFFTMRMKDFLVPGLIGILVSLEMMNCEIKVREIYQFLRLLLLVFLLFFLLLLL